MSLVPDETTTEDETPANDLSLLMDLKSATSNMHYWADARRQYADTLELAQRQVAQADECIAANTRKMNATLVKLGFLNAPEASK